jgi:hypothetical protein
LIGGSSGGGQIKFSYALGSVTAGAGVTGVGGLNETDGPGDVVLTCYAYGNVTAGNGSQDVGGLVGVNTGSITSGIASGNVLTGTLSKDVGSLIGVNDGTADSFSAGSGIVKARAGSTFIGGQIGN